MVDWLLDGVFGWLATQLVDVLGWLLALLTSAFFTSPDVTVLPQVQALAGRSATVVGACFVLAIVVAGALGMAHTSVQIQYEVKDLVPRLVVAFVLSAFAVPLCRGIIEVANALTRTLVGQAASGPRVVAYVQQLLVVSTPPGPAKVLSAVIALLIVVLIFQLLFSWFARVVALLVLAGVAPVAMACYALPQTQPVAVLWWRSLLGALATPLLQGVAFSAGLDLLINPDHVLTSLLGLPRPVGSMAAGVVNLFLVACLLIVTVRIPRFVARYAVTSRSSSTLGVVVRTVVTQAVLRRLRVPGRRRRIP